VTPDALFLIAVLAFNIGLPLAIISVQMLVAWRRELIAHRRVVAYLYEHVWDADETVPQVRGRKLSDLQRYIERELS
jgi:hypothetical protein